MENNQSQATAPPATTLTHSTILGDFRVDFLISDTSLTIEAESLKTGEFFGRTLDNSEIEEFSHQAFSSPADLDDFIGYALDIIDPNASITIDENATIILSQTAKIGAKERTLLYKLELEKKEIDPMEMCEKHVQKLLKMKEGGELTVFEEQTVKVLNQLVRYIMSLRVEVEQEENSNEVDCEGGDVDDEEN